MNKKRRIAIVAGGYSSEYPVSLKSAESIKTFISPELYETHKVKIERTTWQVELSDGACAPVDLNDFSFTENGEKKKFDFAYITIHGTPGENGLLQGYFDMLGIPYSCCGVFAAALTFNKYACNHYLASFGINISPSMLIRRGDAVTPEEVGEKVTYPCFVKPNDGGSSFGTTKVKTPEEFQASLDRALAEGEEAVAEKFMSGTEVTCGCYKTTKRSVVFPITEVVSRNEFFDYEAKYKGAVEEITPARIPETVAEKIKSTTSRIYDLIGCRGIIRVDYIIIGEEPYLLEVNTTPGMTRTSFIPQQAGAMGVPMREILTEIIEDIIANNTPKTRA